jgi:hypothetical protein
MDSFSIASTASSDLTRSLRGYAFLMTVAAVLTALFLGFQPAFAQTFGDYVPGTPTEVKPLMGDSWDAEPQSLAPPTLAPAPTMPTDPPQVPMFTPSLPGTFIEPPIGDAVPSARLTQTPPFSSAGPRFGFGRSIP